MKKKKQEIPVETNAPAGMQSLAQRALKKREQMIAQQQEQSEQETAAPKPEAAASEEAAPLLTVPEEELPETTAEFAPYVPPEAVEEEVILWEPRSEKAAVEPPPEEAPTETPPPLPPKKEALPPVKPRKTSFSAEEIVREEEKKRENLPEKPARKKSSHTEAAKASYAAAMAILDQRANRQRKQMAEKLLKEREAAQPLPTAEQPEEIPTEAPEKYTSVTAKLPPLEVADDVETITEEKQESPTKELKSASFYRRLFSDFKEKSAPKPPTEQQLREQTRKREAIASVKGAVSQNQELPDAEELEAQAQREEKITHISRLGAGISIGLLGSIAAVTAGFLLLGNRPTISYEENRVLTEKPAFSMQALLDGSYTAQWTSYYNDTVPQRSAFKDMIITMLKWTGVQREEDTAFFGNVVQLQTQTTPPPVETEPVTTEITTEPLETEAGMETTAATETTTVTTTVSYVVTEDDGEPPIEIGDGIIMDNKRAISVYGGSFSIGEHYAETLNRYKQDLGEDVKVYSMVAPTAVSYYLPEEYTEYSGSEPDNIDYINSHLQEVLPVDVYNALLVHSQEAIYARTDHHWLPLGAYYAAEAFAKVAEVPFPTLDAYETHTVEGYVGSMYMYTESAILRDNPEDFTYYAPKNHYETEYYNSYFSEPYEDALLMDPEPMADNEYYLVFMGGDDKIAHISTDCDNGRTLVIFKDSYGNALVPCLTNSFTNIYVCDMRYFYRNAIAFCQEVGCTDLLFAMNTYSATGSNEELLEQNRVQY